MDGFRRNFERNSIYVKTGMERNWKNSSFLFFNSNSIKIIGGIEIFGELEK